jgi:hypothetical protein
MTRTNAQINEMKAVYGRGNICQVFPSLSIKQALLNPNYDMHHHQFLVQSNVCRATPFERQKFCLLLTVTSNAEARLLFSLL